MGSSVVDLGPRLALALVLLTALAAVAGRLSGLGLDRPVVVAAVRATVQLAAVSAILLVVVRSLALSALSCWSWSASRPSPRPGGPPG